MRFNHDDDAERDMPARPRLEPPPDFIPCVERLTLHLDRPAPAHSRSFALNGPVQRVYVEHRLNVHDNCPDHWPAHVNRFGIGMCRCGAMMWSPWWVADGLYGLAAKVQDTLPGVRIVSAAETDEAGEWYDGTADWIAEHEQTWVERMASW